MNKYYDPVREIWKDLLKRPSFEFEKTEKTVNYIFKDIQINGDRAAKHYAKKYDRFEIDSFLVSKDEFQEASRMLGKPLKDSIKLAKNNIEIFHRAQQTETVKTETSKGVVCWQEKKPIEKVGLYIPGGTAPLFSSILMLAIPAGIAGCKEIIICTPPDKNGKIHPSVLYTAKLCGVEKVYKIGGIQAIAAMTFGTESIPQVYKIFGPGNQYVTIAKQTATKYGIAIDLPAGPSELLVLADETANAAFAASDLLSQAEHGEDSQVILVSRSKEFLERVEKEIDQQLKVLPRILIARESIGNSKLIYCSTDEMAIELINSYAPEHLIISVKNEDLYLEKIINAGSVFIGKYTPESAGDYASGTNHTLPTAGYAKMYSGVNLDAFLKTITYQKISEEGMLTIGPAIENMAEAEGLFAHKNAVSLRLKSINDE